MSTRVAALEASPARRDGRPALAGAWAVSASMLASGALIYAFHAGAARTLGSAAYGRIAVLWAAMFLVVIVVFRPLEQVAAQGIANRLARGEESRSVVRAVAVLGAAVTGAIALAFVAAWPAIADGLFAGDDVLTAMLLAGIVCYGVAYVSRGVITGVRWYGGYGLALTADATARLVLAAPLVLVASTEVAAAAVALAGLAGALAPIPAGRRRLAAAVADGPGERFSLAHALRFAAPASVIAATDQLLVNAGPLLVTLEGGAAAAAGLVFAATMLVRVPVYVFQGLASSILPNLAHLSVGADAPAFRRAAAESALLLAAVGLLIVAFAAAAGPESLRLVYGEEFEAGRTALVLLGAGVACYLAATTCSQALLALGRSGRAAVVWAASAVLFVALYAQLGGSELDRVSAAFACATAADLVLLAGVLSRSGPR